MTYHTTRTILYRYSIYFVVDGQGMPSYHGFVDSERHNIIPRNVPTKNSTALPTATIRQPSCDGTSRRYQIFCRRYRRLIAMPKLPLGRWYNNNKLLSEMSKRRTENSVDYTRDLQQPSWRNVQCMQNRVTFFFSSYGKFTYTSLSPLLFYCTLVYEGGSCHF